MGNGIRKVKTSDLELKDRLVSIQRVTKVTKGGRTFSFSAIVVVGNEDGIVGHGLGKASEVTTAIAKGIEDAKKNLIKVPVHNGTIPHEQVAKFGGAKVFIKPASPGTGVKAGGAMRAELESVGVHNVLAKSKGSSNPHNVVKATFKALARANVADATPILLSAMGRGNKAPKTRAIAFGFQVVLGTLVNAILNDPGPLSIHDREMEARLGNCLLLLLQAEMTPPAAGVSRRRKQ
jgi:small subunit ribosomal protein S5